MFVDIEGCTHLCEDLPPSQMTRVIETYFSRYLDVVRDAGGEVTELLGDGLVALFEGPSIREDIARAARAALRIREVTGALSARGWGRHRHPIVVNIGLNAGVASVGTTRLRGRSGERRFYKATGPVTNVAARLCALASRGQILVSGSVATYLQQWCQLRVLGPYTLKNVTGPVEVVEILLGRSGPEARSSETRPTSYPAGGHTGSEGGR